MKKIIVMTRVPYPGATKTRLMPNVSPLGCAELHLAFLSDIRDTLLSLDDCKYSVYFAIAPEHIESEFAERIPVIGDCFIQEGDSLGERMKHAFGQVLTEKDSVILIGTDVPQVEADHIIEAFKALDSHDVVIAPTFDGGYWMIGMKHLHEAIFQNHDWGGKSVYETTQKILEENGLTSVECTKLMDIDTFEELQMLKSFFRLNRETHDASELLKNTQTWFRSFHNYS